MNTTTTTTTRRTLRYFAAIVSAYIVLAVPALIWPDYLDTLPGRIAAVPILSIYLLHAVGVPGLLEQGGACGWGWCQPTNFGWLLLFLLWVGLAWLAAKLIAVLIAMRAGASKT